MNFLQRLLIRYGIGYVKIDDPEESLWREAIRHAPLSYRWFGRSVSIHEVDLRFRDWPKWGAARRLIEVGDRIWPFEFNTLTLALRRGYVIVRNGKPVGGVLIEVS